MDVTKDSKKRRAPGGLSPGVWSVGAASFFSDSGHEIVTSVLPSFVTSVLGAPPHHSG